MSNSPLVVYTKISPNKTSPRNHIIDTITIHTMAGNCTVETCGEIFTPTSRQASSNYGIDSKGRIAMYVEEKDRSWCSSNKANDHRAVTIEVASTNNTDYAPSNDAYNALINLCVDICKRNNIKQLLWKADKNLIGQIDQQNMTVHRWFKNKACLPIDTTELLTKNGWVKLKNIKVGDEIATVQLDTFNIIFDKVLDVVEPYEAECYTYKDLTATSDHRVVVFNNHDLKHVKYFHEVYHSYSFSIPGAGFYKGKGLDLTDDELKFLIALQADGHYMYENREYHNGERVKNNNKKYYGIEFHIKKERKINRILDIIDKCNFDKAPNINYKSDGSISIRLYDKKALDLGFKFLEDKCFTWDWINMNPHQAEIFLLEILLWDGSIENRAYFSTDPINRDIVCAIGALNGVPSLFNNTKNGIDISVTLKSFKRYPSEQSKLIRNKKKLVSCVTVNSGFILIRQERRTTVVGNCPGDWLYNHMGEIASDVNTKLNDGSKVVVPVVETNETRLYKFLKAKGLNDNAIYGIIGNIFAESGCQSQNLQNSFEKKLGYSDDEYTSAVDNGSYTNFIHDSAGYGLCQWTYWSRKQNLFNFAKKQGVSIGNMDMQMNFFWQELQGYKGIIDSLKKCNTIKEASNIMLHQYEKPADQSATVENKRAKYGEEAKVRIEATLAGKTSATVTNTTSSTTTTSSKVINGITVKPYTVKILVDALNYRNGPGTNYGRLGTVKKGSIYTIIEESEDRAWGKLKSGAGWISLNSKYVSKTSTSTNTTTSTTSKLPYTIKITCNALNYRKGPGTNYATVGTVKKGQVFTIIEEKTGTGAKLWGKLKSGAGWIAIDERYNIKN